MTLDHRDTTTETSLFDSFRTALPEYSPCPLWWWSGDTLDPERLRWQLERYRDGGVWNLVVINLAPTGPLYGHFADDPPFMSARWWEMFRVVCEHARTLGMKIWFYDQIGFSGANIQGQLIARTPEYAGQTLERAVQEGGDAVSVACPPGGTPLVATVRPLDADGHPTGMPEIVSIADGTAHWSGEGRARLSLFYTARRGFDYFSVDTCGALLDAIHGEFERQAGDFFDDVIAGTFQDELPPMPSWGEKFAVEFERLHGYDLLPQLDGLWEDLDGREGRVRHDYHAARAALAERAFFRPLFDWHDARGMTVGVDQQNPARAGDPEGGVRLYADYLRTHRWFSAPGSDHHGEAKVHASLAHLYGRGRVWLEAFHTSGWGGTIEETFDWLVPWLRAGVTLYNPHATYYGTRGGWFEWAPPSTDWRQPYWSHYRAFADAVARLCRLLGAGTHRCDVGVLYPTATVQAGLGLDGAISRDAELAHEAYISLVGSMVWFDQHTGALDAIGVDYDILDDDSLARATIENGRLRIADESFGTVILPSYSVIERATGEALVRFAEAGGEVLALGRPPAHLTGDDSDGLIERLRARIAVVSDEDLRDRLKDTDALVTAPVPTLIRHVGEQTVVFVPGAFPGASRISGWPVATIAFDRTAYPDGMTIRVRDVEGAPELWDPFRGTRTAVPPSRWRAVPGGVEVDIPFAGAPCAVLVWGAGDAPEAARRAAPASVIVELDDIWEVELVPTLDNQWGDFTFPPTSPPMPVQQWTFQRGGSEVGDDAPVVATFGPRAEWTGPGDPGELAAADPGDAWNVAAWSLSRGIHKDPLHRFRLGPAGHVPEEFLDFGQVRPGQAVRVRSSFSLDERFAGWLVVGAAAEKRVLVDGVYIAIDPDENLRYVTATAVSLDPGTYTVDILLTARHEVRLRAWMALVSDLDACRRPDSLTVADEPRLETAVRFERAYTVDGAVRSGVFQVGTRGPARIELDGREIGRQGGYLPYGDGSAVQRYDITPSVSLGEHVLAVTIDDTGLPITLAVDGVVEYENGGPDLWLTTDASWTVTRNGVPAQLAIEPRPAGDPQLAHLRQRPHPLPGAAWLEGAATDTGAVRPTAWFLPGASGTTERLRCIVPPGATQATIPAMGRASAALDGEPVGETEPLSTGSWTVPLPGAERISRVLELTVQAPPGCSGGAALAGPIEYVTGLGRMPLGNWEELGLRDYSGMVTYQQQVTVPELPPTGAIHLDLGHVRGSLDVRMDGEPVGTCVVAPFRVDVTGPVRRSSGSILVEVTVANTLGPYLQATSPTPFVLDGQTVSGLFGPVRLVHIPE